MAHTAHASKGEQTTHHTPHTTQTPTMDFDGTKLPIKGDNGGKSPARSFHQPTTTTHYGQWPRHEWQRGREKQTMPCCIPMLACLYGDRCLEVGCGYARGLAWLVVVGEPQPGGGNVSFHWWDERCDKS